MAQLTASNAAAFGHQGAQGGLAFYSAGMAKPISLGHCFYMVRGRGWPSCYFPVTGSLPSAAAESEGAAAATPSALSTPSGTTLTPAKYLISIGINDEAQHRALAENDPVQLAKEFAAYGCSVYLMKDDTVGLSEVFGTVTASGGNSGARLTVDGTFDCAEDVRANLDDANLVVSCIFDGKGQRDIQYDLNTNASAVLSNPAVQSVVKAVLADPNAQQASIDTGFWFAPDGKTPYFVEAGYSMLDQSGGNRIGTCCISPTPVIQNLPGVTITSKMQQGARQISPAYAIAVDEDLISASRMTTAKPPEIVPTVAGPIALMERAYTGGAFYVLDARGSGDVALVNDNSASKLLYLA